MDSSQASQSKMELFRGVLHSILSVLVLIPNKGFCSSCIGNKCDCVKQIGIIDCSRAGLKLIPRTKKRMVNYTALSLRDNLLLEVNFTVLMEQFPDLKTVDAQLMLVHNLTQSFHINLTTSDFTDSDLPSTVYLTFYLRVVIKCLVMRRRRQQNVMGHSFKMIPFNLETSTDESDEQVIFDVTAL